LKSYFYKSLFLILLFSLSSSFAQYTFQDSALIRTTFIREFNKKIIKEYLHSEDARQVNAALLSISHSNDTTFVDSIINLDFSKYGKNISFVLGQLGESKKSTSFLFEMLQSKNLEFGKGIYNSIGLCGDSSTLQLLFELIDSGKIVTSGLPFAITNFYFRGIKSDESISRLLKILKTDTSNLSNNEIRTNEFNVFFALYRIGSSKDAIPELTKFASSDVNNQTKSYILANFRKLKYFPNDIKLFKKLIHSESWEIRTELANSACYINFKNDEEVKLYLSLLNDENPNVSRTAAIALKNIKYLRNKKLFKTKLNNLLVEKDLTKNAKGELFISYTSLFGLSAEEAIDEYEDFVEQKFIYRMMANNKSDWEFNYEYLIDRIPESSEVELLDLLHAYLILQNKFITNKEYAQYLFTVMQSNMPSSVSIIADELKLPVIHNYREVLQELVLEQIFKNKNNPQFAETIVSLAKLSYQIDRTFYDSVIDMLATSKLYSVKKYALDKQGSKIVIPKDSKLFGNLWNYAFKYRTAKIITNKGSFSIKLNSEFAPMTCANFISLAKNGFYNNVNFHRVVPNFVIQTGDTSGTGWGGPGYEIVSEFSPLPFNKGAIGIASIGKDTEGSQWFVMHSLFPHLDGHYTNWAKVIAGIEVVDIIDESDKIINVEIE
jgi:cyclophilin family peptidyl-prolyl cis-trans isomerase